MSATRMVFWAGLALAFGTAIALAAFGLKVAVEARPVVLVPDSLGRLMWPVCVPVAPDSVRSVIRWWPARLAQ